METPILITGCARSGTSMIAGAINMCGAFGGVMSGPNRNNQKGMFENAQIRNNVVKPFLRNNQLDILCQFPLPDTHSIEIPDNWRNQVERIIKNEGYQEGPWMYKDPKAALLWTLWAKHFPASKWVIVRRSTNDIISSCIKTGFMRAFNNDQNQRKVGASNIREGWAWWVNYHIQRFEELKNKVECREVWPEKMINGDFTELKEVIEWLGLEWNSEVLTFVDSQLWKSRKRR